MPFEQAQPVAGGPLPLLAKARVLDSHPQGFHLIETMSHGAGRGLRSLDAHLARVGTSATYFGFRFDTATVRAALAARLAGAGDARVRLRCYRDGALGIDARCAVELRQRNVRQGPLG